MTHVPFSLLNKVSSHNPSEPHRLKQIELVRTMRDKFYLLLSYCFVYLSYCLFIKQLYNTDGRQSNPSLCLLPGQEVIPTVTLLSPRLNVALFTSIPQYMFLSVRVSYIIVITHITILKLFFPHKFVSLFKL